MQSEDSSDLHQKSMLNALDHVFSQRLSQLDDSGFLNKNQIGVEAKQS